MSANWVELLYQNVFTIRTNSNIKILEEWMLIELTLLKMHLCPVIDTNSIITSNSRSIGVEHIVLTQLNELGFFPNLNQGGFTEMEQFYAAAQIIARMAHPVSERETARWLRNDSATAELLGTDFSHISDQILHRVADKILEKKTL